MQFAAFGSWSSWTQGHTRGWKAADVESLAVGFAGLAYIGYAITAVLFVIWFFQAYKSAASRGATGTRWGAGWTIGSWFIPFANWVIPKLVMNEVDRMSNPMTGEPPIEQRWKRMPRLVVSDIWWIALIMAIAFQMVSQAVFIVAENALDDAYGVGLLVVALTLGLYAVSGVLLGITTLKIGKRLRTPRA